MLPLSQSVDYSSSRSPMEKPCYTQLQPVNIDHSIGSLITSSTNICLPDNLGGGDSSCSRYSGSSQGGQHPLHPHHPDQHYHHSHPLHYSNYSSDDSRVSSHSPKSVYEEELSDIQEVLQPRMTGCRDDDDDDSSVILELMDLAFLDHSDSRGDSVDLLSSSGRRQDVPSYLSSGDSEYYSTALPAHQPHPHQHEHTNNYPSPPYAHTTSTNSGTTGPPTLTRYHHQHNHHHQDPLDHHHPRYRPSPPIHAPTPLTSTTAASSSSSPSSTSASGWSLYYYNTPTVIRPHDLHHPYHSNNHHHLHRPHDQQQPHPCHARAPPTPSPSPSSHLRDLKSAGRALPSLSSMEMMDDDDENGDAEYKPYCDSRRGAKKNLLWKFLLWVLDNHSDLAQWTDVKKGVFKFVDTARISTLWGQRKHKNDMTFEKLSRGIRHYYKRGLMERMSNTRLVYKFNWDKVPQRHRKA